MADNTDAPQGLTEREADVYRLTVVNRLTQRAIGERMGISQERVSQMLRAARAKLPPVDLEAIRREALELHEDVIRRALWVAELAGAPITAGKDGDIVLDPEGGGVVRDYAGQMAALKVALAADAERRKLLGADSASKIESTATVRYVIENVDLDNLR